ncbi:MAG TPA: biopolymer transporter ExbD [Nannocystaceae bacterium]|nr:biopolymer transporter ExbD [Nannocystaceae bacterium]
MSMSAGGGGGGAKSEINVTPLVDVCLVLLIIFMVLVPRNVPEISVRVPPESKQRQKPPTEEPLVIGLSSEGAITLNKNVIDKSKLADTIGNQLKFRDKKVVFIDFDDKAKYGTAVEILDLAKTSGAEVLGIIKPKDKSRTPDRLNG